MTYMFTHICLHFTWIRISTCTTTTVKMPKRIKAGDFSFGDTVPMTWLDSLPQSPPVLHSDSNFLWSHRDQTSHFAQYCALWTQTCKTKRRMISDCSHWLDGSPGNLLFCIPILNVFGRCQIEGPHRDVNSRFALHCYFRINKWLATSMVIR